MYLHSQNTSDGYYCPYCSNTNGVTVPITSGVTVAIFLPVVNDLMSDEQKAQDEEAFKVVVHKPKRNLRKPTKVNRVSS